MTYKYATLVGPSTNQDITGRAIVLSSSSAATVTITPRNQSGTVSITMTPGVILPIAVKNVTTGAGVSVLVLG